jgi:hypothetical protein
LAVKICHAQPSQGDPASSREKGKTERRGPAVSEEHAAGARSLAQRGCRRLPGLADPGRIGVDAAGPGPIPR